MVVMEGLNRAVMEIPPVDLMVGVARVVKARMEALATTEDRKAVLDQEATEGRMETLAQEAMEDRMETLAQEAMEDRMEILDQETTEAQTATPAQETTEDRKTAQALTMVLVSRTQALSHKSTCTRR